MNGEVGVGSCANGTGTAERKVFINELPVRDHIGGTAHA
jgi:hypothetical protein